MAHLRVDYRPEGGDSRYTMHLNLSSAGHGVEEAGNAGREFTTTLAPLMDHYLEEVTSFPSNRDAEIELQVQGNLPDGDRRVLESFIGMHEIIAGRR